MRIQRVSILLSILIFLALPLTAHAADGGRLRLSASATTPAVGQEVTVDVLVEDAPTIYGADVSLAFDPALLEVVDSDGRAAGIQLKPGDFIDANKSFILRHGADNKKGTIDYALSLLNPAPPVKGNGRLVQITFRTKATGQAMISIKEGLFGTQTGETIAPALDTIEVKITTEGGGALASAIDPIRQLLENNGVSKNSSNGAVAILGVVLVIGLAGVGLLGRRLWRRRNQRRI